MSKTSKLFSSALNAINNNNFDNLHTVLNSGFDINEKDKDGRSIIFHAVLENNKKMVETLIDIGADVNISDNSGWSPLHYAVQDYLVDITELLIEKGADVNAKDEFGNTILFRAVFTSKGRGEIIKILKSNGADPNIKNDSDVSALDLADTIANYDIKQFI